MNHIKLTENLFVNPLSVACVQFIRAGRYGPEALFDITFTSLDIEPIRLCSPDAEEALKNWSAAHDHNATNTKPMPPSIRSIGDA